jgi:outer membrane murein-binding lipoprotein Lpp
MPILNSHADIVRDWEGLLDAVLRSPEVQAGVEAERFAVEQWLAKVRDLKARQDELSALRQAVTQDLKAAVLSGKEAAIQLRAILKAKFGPRNERLVHFNVAPLRKRVRRPVVEEKREKLVGEEASGGQRTSSPAKSAE